MVNHCTSLTVAVIKTKFVQWPPACVRTVAQATTTSWPTELHTKFCLGSSFDLKCKNITCYITNITYGALYYQLYFCTLNLPLSILTQLLYIQLKFYCRYCKYSYPRMCQSQWSTTSSMWSDILCIHWRRYNGLISICACVVTTNCKQE